MKRLPLPKGLLPPISLVLFSLAIISAPGKSSQLAVETDDQPLAIISTAINPETTSSFETSEYTTGQTIPFKTLYELDPTLPCGQEKIRQEGKEGKIVKHFRRIIWQGNTLNDEFLSTDKEPAVDEIIVLGVKPGEMFTIDGHNYNCVLKNFWATSYDGKCLGCSGRTHYTDEPVSHGICAVNPDLISPLSYFHIPGYGRCKAADKGGGLESKRVDLGFDDVKNGWWSARHTDIYLLR